MAKKGLAYINNRFISLDRAAVPVTDIGFQRCFGVNEVMRVYNSKVLELDLHMQRLTRSAKLIGLKIPSLRTIKQVIQKGVSRVGGDLLVKVIITGGDGYQLLPGVKPGFYVIFSPVHKHGKAYYTRGVRAISFVHQRGLSAAKHLNYLDAVIYHQQALKKGVDEAIYLDKQNGRVLEGTTFSVGIIKGRKLIVPQRDVLLGTTMQIVLRLVEKLNFSVVRRDVFYRELIAADEAFITSVVREIAPLTKVDGKKIGLGRPGPLTKQLQGAFYEYVKNQND